MAFLSMRDWMSHAVIWIVAYLFTGLSYVTVTRDAKEDVFNRPRYLLTTGGSFRAMLAWPFIAFMGNSAARAFAHAVLFAIVGGIGEVIGLAI
jgi:hypothetical protein